MRGIAPYKSLARVLSSVREYVVDSVDIKNYVAQKAASEPEQRAKHQVIVLVTGDISGDNSPESYEHFIALMEQYIEPAKYRMVLCWRVTTIIIRTLKNILAAVI